MQSGMIASIHQTGIIVAVEYSLVGCTVVFFKMKKTYRMIAVIEWVKSKRTDKVVCFLVLMMENIIVPEMDVVIIENPAKKTQIFLFYIVLPGIF